MKPKSVSVSQERTFVTSPRLTSIIGPQGRMIIAGGYICPTAITMHIDGFRQCECLEITTVSLGGTEKTWRVETASCFDIHAQEHVFKAMREHGFDLFCLEKRQILLDTARAMRLSEDKKNRIPFKTTVEDADLYQPLSFEESGLSNASSFRAHPVLHPGDRHENMHAQGDGLNCFVADETGRIVEYVVPFSDKQYVEKQINWHAAAGLMLMDESTGGMVTERRDLGLATPCLTFLFPEGKEPVIKARTE